MLWTCCGFAVGGIMTHFFYKMADFDDDMLLACSSLECESKKFTAPLMFSGNFPKRLRIFYKILYACYSFKLTLNCKILFNYRQL